MFFVPNYGEYLVVNFGALVVLVGALMLTLSLIGIYTGWLSTHSPLYYILSASGSVMMIVGGMLNREYVLGVCVLVCVWFASALREHMRE